MTLMMAWTDGTRLDSKQMLRGMKTAINARVAEMELAYLIFERIQTSIYWLRSQLALRIMGKIFICMLENKCQV